MTDLKYSCLACETEPSKSPVWDKNDLKVFKFCKSHGEEIMEKEKQKESRPAQTIEHNCAPDFRPTVILRNTAALDILMGECPNCHKMVYKKIEI